MIEPPLELLETWLLDWEGDLYGQLVGIELIAFIRPEMKLASLEALTAQVHADADAARALLQG
jgi:riboflavin kinase/FMN adenylyltransferase